MKIGLISDTHIDRTDACLPHQVQTAFKDVELILHAGDIWIPSVLDELETIAPVVSAWGDDDFEHELGGDARMAEHRAHYIEDYTVWLMHEKPPYGYIVPRENKVFSRQAVTNHEVPDVVVYGHTHVCKIEQYKGVVIVNPGSPTWPNNFPVLGTVGILTLEPEKKIKAEIIHLNQL